MIMKRKNPTMLDQKIERRMVFFIYFCQDMKEDGHLLDGVSYLKYLGRYLP